MKNFITASLLGIVALATTSLSFAEDIELYISDAAKASAKKSKVLIILDNSGSMGTLHNVDEPYNLDESTAPDYYPPDGNSHAYNDNATYFNKGGADGSVTIPDSPSDGRRFNVLVNSCESSKEALRTKGVYTGHIREYNLKGNSGTWDEIRDNNGFNTIKVIDCQEDVDKERPQNIDSLDPGYPADNLGTKQNPVYHTPLAANSDVTWSGPLVTLYTANYLRWYHSALKAEITESRFETAIRSITNVIETTDGIEFGLEIFNHNYNGNNNGGRVVYGIKEMTTTNEASLISMIDNDLTTGPWTPLCESTYEAQQYFAGKAVEYGDDAFNSSRPIADSTIVTAGKYVTPFNECTDKAYVILITDGEPTYDTDADSKVTALTSKEPDGVDADGDPAFKNVTFTGTHEDFDNSTYNDDDLSTASYLPALAGWMNKYDINLALDGVQTVSTHTIGFSAGAADAKGLLTETAKRGGGQYFSANDGLQLTAALQSTLRSLAPANNSLTSASVAANNFDRTETLDSVYYAMFDPQNGPRWQGNLKKYKVIDSVQYGANKIPAVNEETGQFSTTVKSYWSSSVDGNLVSKGGVVDWFAKQAVVDRTVYSDIGDDGALALLNTDALVGNEQKFADDLGIALTDVTDYFNWNLGMDVDDEDKDGYITDMRADVFGDPLHSKPLVINYGTSIRIVVGTNAGALHMFADAGDTVAEKWAFMPTELFPNITGLRDNYSSADKIYGVDGQITSYINDKDGDGVIETGDTVWIFFGLRRGGDSYYALDISNPDSPSLMWHIKSGTTGFENLGQTWSQPKIGFSKLNLTGKVASPVLFFGGGYDTNKDSYTPGASDSKGQSVYMVDAKTGALKWSMAPTGGDTTFAGTDSIPSSIGLLDSSGNGLIDRLYTGDTGGNVWRVDMPSDNKADFSVFKLASLGGNTNATDRRFFYEPSIVRTFIAETIETDVTDKEGVTTTITVHQEKPYDAILIGSGDRTNPLGTDTDDSFFMIKDEHIKTQTFSASSTPATPTAFTEADLFDFTTDRFAATMTTQARETLELEVSAKSGWFIDFPPNKGEKNSSKAIVLNGIVYYTSFIPPEFASVLVDCKPPTGKGRLYAVDLALGTKRYDRRILMELDGVFLDTPTLFSVSDPVDPDDPDVPYDPDAPIHPSVKLIVDKLMSEDINFNYQTMRTYLYVTEEQ